MTTSADDLDPLALRRAILDILSARVDEAPERRTEALREFFSVSLPNVTASDASTLADHAPPLMPALWRKWIILFADRLLETVPLPQIADLCADTPESRAALALVFVMFMESARMEEQVAKDLAAYSSCASGNPQEDALAAALGGYVRERMAELKEKKEGRDSEGTTH